MNSSNPKHALSFDVEEYFQVANLRPFVSREDWQNIPSRLMVGMEDILQLLDKHNVKATMFFLGWIAEQHPELVARCVDAGHEIASHGYEHLFVSAMDPESFNRDLERTEEALMAAGAPRPVGFRASTFTITRETWWAFDVLVERGYVYDSSVHPVRHPTYGVPDFEPGISQVSAPNGAGSIIEFPVATYPLMGRNWPVGGGGYFRLLPGWIHRRFIRRLEAMGRPTATYLHPWEFDPEQPRYAASASSRFRHYLNLDKTLDRLDKLIQIGNFSTMQRVLEAHGHASAFSGSPSGS
ncbi:MAG: polysaccharide deacetylase family protein (PEP-CTERM system associated) [Planctomycetota bacterium]|jgi:polysaccharide deacetylase family protein (PEP-CTERM system associated)